MILGWEALSLVTPHIFIDTMGYAFTYPIFKIFGGCRVACYVHYPTISMDMLSMIFERRPSYNNDSRIAQSKFKTLLKYCYYLWFAKLYGFMGSFSEIVMVNSSWTRSHINSIWKIPNRTKKVYPPCNTSEFQQLRLVPRENLIISIGQFRPEKDHNLQLDAMKSFLSSNPSWKGKVKLVLIGSSRNQGDEQRVKQLMTRCENEGLSQDIQFEINVPFSKLKEWLSIAKIGIHTMWNEHFGIGIVEFMGAGVIPVAHNSGGPKADIVVNYSSQSNNSQTERTGFLATSANEYANHFLTILQMSEAERLAIQQNARESADRFSDQKFSARFKKYVSILYH